MIDIDVHAPKPDQHAVPSTTMTNIHGTSPSARIVLQGVSKRSHHQPTLGEEGNKIGTAPSKYTRAARPFGQTLMGVRDLPEGSTNIDNFCLNEISRSR